MSSKSEKADAIKDHAIHGRFDQIEVKFGEKAAIKGREYAASKLLAFKARIGSGEDVSGQKIATPFMLFAVNTEGSQDMVQLEHLFKQSIAENADQSDDLDSVATQPQETQIVEVANAVENGIIDDKSGAFILLTQPEQEASIQVATTTKKSSFQIPKSQGEVVVRSQVSPTQIVGKTIKRSGKGPNAKSTLSSLSGVIKSSKSKLKHSKIDAKKERRCKVSDYPNAPMKSKNAQECFMEANREDAEARSPEQIATEITKELKIAWKALPADERAIYEENSIAEKARYTEQMRQYHENFSEEAEEYRLAVAKRTKSSEKSSPRLRKNFGGVEGSDGDEPAYIDEEGDDDKYDDSSNNEVMIDDEGIVNQIGQNGAVMSSDDLTPRHSLALIAVSMPQSKKRLLATSTKRGSKKFTLQRKISTSPLHKKANRKSGSSDHTPLRPQPEVPYIDADASAAKTAKIVSALKGIKSSDLPISEDILRTKTVPREKCPFPDDFIPSVGDKVTLILEPYREFISELNTALIAPADLELAQTTCLLTSVTAHATVLESKKLEESDEEQNSIKGYKSIQILVLQIGTEQHTIVYMPFSSPLLHTEIYLLDRKTFSKSLAASWLIPNAQVRRLFSAKSGLVCEWQEGSIYHVTTDMKTNPFASISVVWMQLEQNPKFWFYSYEQLDNLCSPWDLELSQYVLPANVRVTPLPRSLAVGNITATAVIHYLESFDFSSVFMYKLTDTKEYCDLFPKIRDRLDLHEINRRCKQGQYKGNSGLASLFDDLILMCTNGKKFNSGNAGFQPWIMVDMMEKTLSRVLLSQKGTFTKHGCITSSATASSTSSQCLKSDSSQNNSNVDDDPFQEEDAFQDIKSTILNDFDEEEFTQEV